MKATTSREDAIVKVNWKPDPDDPDGYLAVILHNEGEVRLAANTYGWRAWVLGSLARDIILTEEHRRRDARATGKVRSTTTIAREAAERFAASLIERAGEES